jgi:transglutaminase-like putative cysteine protease/predicted glutamine amidotransferase
MEAPSAMSELVALCLDANTSPAVQFAAARPGEAGGVYGWGVGWYPGSERGAAVVKDPTSTGATTVSNALGDWNRFRSTIFVSHVRGHRRPRNQEDAQPFVRSYGGRQWIFAHDGDLAPDYAERFPLGDDPAFDPLGRTDSEHAFCWLLSRLHAERARSLADVPPERLHAWLRTLNEGGQLNLLLTEGEHVAAYHDAAGAGTLYWTRRVPPHATAQLRSESIEIRLDSPEDPNRTALLFSSAPLTADGWQAVSAGGLILGRRGQVTWTDVPELGRGGSGQRDRALAPPPGQVQTGQQLAAAQPLAAAPASGSGLSPIGRTLAIVHRTHYAYETPVERSSHRLLLHPLEDRSQRILEYSLTLDPNVARSEYEDVFGNLALSFEIERPFWQLEVLSRAVVRVGPRPSLEERTAKRRHSIPVAWMPWQRQMLSAYLLPPELPETQLRELSEFAMSFVERNDYDLVSTLLDLNETIYHDFEYVSGSTTNETTAFEVYESRRGVCQDFANLLICLARLLNVPARYRMGYIYTGANYANKVQSEASHAWVELYVPWVGWHGFDPTNGIQVGSDHVLVACGRNYRDATPTSGPIYRGAGLETLTVSVRVEEAAGG